jgi:hypothetical protein
VITKRASSAMGRSPAAPYPLKSPGSSKDALLFRARVTPTASMSLGSIRRHPQGAEHAVSGITASLRPVWYAPFLRTTSRPYGFEEVGMRIQWGATCLMFSLTVVLLGCGSYSAPNNPPMSPDSTTDSTPPPAYSR